MVDSQVPADLRPRRQFGTADEQIREQTIDRVGQIVKRAIERIFLAMIKIAGKPE